MRSAFALRIFSGRIILNFAFVALCGALQTHFHGRGWNEPSQSRLTACQLPRRGSFIRADRKMLKSSPFGGAVAQRLRGFESAEPEKMVKRSSRRTGVNLQFFPV